MKISDITTTANGNLRKSKLRTFLTVSAVFIGTLTLILTTGVGAGLKTYVNEQVEAAGAKDVMVISAADEGSGSPIANDEPKPYDADAKPKSQFGGAVLQTNDIEKIKSVPGIKDVTPLYPIAAEYVSSDDKKFQASVTQTTEGVNQPLLSGRLVNANGNDFEITIPSGFVGALQLGDNQSALGKQLTFAFKDPAGQLFTQEATVVGVQEKSLINGNEITANTAFIKAAFKKATAGIPDYQAERFLMAFAHFDKSFSSAQIGELKNNLKQQGYNGSTLDDQLGIIRSIINGIITFLNIFAGIALVAATFGIVNTLLMAVQERTREIGLMKALGMSKNKIFALFSIEAILIGFWGGIIALGVANLLGRLGNTLASKTIFKDFEGLQLFSFPLLPMLSIIGLIMAIAFIAGALPAYRASKLDPIEALRYE